MRILACLTCTFVLLSLTLAQAPDTRDVPYKTGQYDAITDVPGVKVGHFAETKGTMRGVTVVVIGEKGGTCGAEVRGGWPGTLGVSAYKTVNFGDECDAIVLTGGSLWGYATVPGVMEYLFSQGKGTQTRAGILPVVPAAVIFDLPIGDAKVHPQAEWGFKAAQSATGGPVEQGNVGVGAGGTIGKHPGGIRMKGGLGTASAVIPDGIVVGVIVVLNAVGDVVNPKTGEFYATSGGFDSALYRHRFYVPGAQESARRASENTTLAIVATNARLDKTQLNKIAQLAHDGLARAIRPMHTMLDGDTVFAASVRSDNSINVPARYPAEATDRIGNVAADLVVRAILKGVQAAESIPGWPSYKEWKQKNSHQGR